MTFISYAQNFEDVILWRALKHLGKGLYIDVGANDPTADSVTKAFYERGWNGINIDPLPCHHESLSRERPRDINLPFAVGETGGVIDIWECDVRGWATASEEVVSQHRANGHIGVFHKVQLVQLNDICAEYVQGEIHFLKIDVEGFEEAVLRGNNWSKYRPWVVVVEATIPSTPKEAYEPWEPILLLSNYQLAYADGLNRFYVAKEHSELLPAFKYPPNVFDEFKLVGHHYAEARAAQAEAHISDLINSASWRITAPLRWAMRVMHHLSPKKLKQLVKVLLQHSAQVIHSHPRLKRLVVCLLHRLPSLKTRLTLLTSGTMTARRAYTPGVPTELAHLTPHARRIYAELKAAIAQHHQGQA